MAGERKGQAYEALVYFALHELQKNAQLKGQVFRNVTPRGMTIEPDLMVGDDVNHPDLIILVTHSIAAPKSNMKFWRNIAELAESKTRLRTVPKVYSLGFGSAIREDLKILQAKAFDGQLIVSDAPYGVVLQSWAETHSIELGEFANSPNVNLRNTILAAMSLEPELYSALRSFIADLQILLQQSKPDLEQLWRLERLRMSSEAPLARKTSVRRGLTKLMLLPKIYLDAVIAGKRDLPLDPLLKPAAIVGVIHKKIGGYRLVDQETIGALEIISGATALKILSEPLAPGFQAVVDQVKSIAVLEEMLNVLVDQYDELVKPVNMFSVLRLQHDDPCYLFPSGVGITPTDVWMFRLVIECIKTAGGTKQSYGSSQLVEDLRVAADSEGFRAYVRGTTGNANWTLPSSTEPVRRGLQDYVNRIPNTRFSDAFLAATAFVLSQRLAQISKDKLRNQLVQLRDTWKSSTVEARFLTHLAFDPLGLIIQDCLAASRYELIFLKVCFAEAATELRNSLTGTTKVLRMSQTLVNWQSVTDAGRNHKRKELCGRVVALRYSWDPITHTFVPRPGISRLILVLDGTWRQEDLDTLMLAGWDAIFYPDEMDQLLQAIV